MAPYLVFILVSKFTHPVSLVFFSQNAQAFTYPPYYNYKIDRIYRVRINLYSVFTLVNHYNTVTDFNLVYFGCLVMPACMQVND